jgi:hypothetical protein
MLSVIKKEGPEGSGRKPSKDRPNVLMAKNEDPDPVISSLPY